MVLVGTLFTTKLSIMQVKFDLLFFTQIDCYLIKIGIIELSCGNHVVADICKYANPKESGVTFFTVLHFMSNIFWFALKM